MTLKAILKAGCLFTTIIFVILIGFIGISLFLWVDTYDFSDFKAKKVIADSDFQKVEKYLKEHKEINFISYEGDNQSKDEKLWKVNNLLIDYDSSLVFIIPENFNFYSRQTLINNPSIIRLTLEDYLKVDTLPYQLDINSLDSILITIKKFEFISVSVDSTKINYRLRFNSPISQGFGILSYLENREHQVSSTEYVEYSKLDSKHFKYKEFVD